ncbi:MAG: hypothetical protein KZQ66_14170 [Candidatus Thiodiazotropha sp. (ex Lucinoma aequizonata)]|nr:hypothetical protein [Candidatus Thiodiazotropha sp. (ex Lucinoma aequizonata)]MCU7895574.1 hypothetical protein [Candidatus Thiodiazotropha sp. (ex Lucinoma aequizonata)]MCU7898858.1 hypothetical protein [Candidatus Thiodiazotropha sp. (ex Lucinoma aequizonata)]MCU7902997.1 hypothetical protein [Candidatus Thiodiazotropha sp. (ex Lucinoma aequizonata)]MCU7910571.1 hypothetical protein [Candidatus Thiodiazotropha sp. (ex Lucinoma aequizonata)]
MTNVDSLSVAIPAIQPRLHLSGTNRLRSAFHSGQRIFRPISIESLVKFSQFFF